jgi:hypothetical protein
VLVVKIHYLRFVALSAPDSRQNVEALGMAALRRGRAGALGSRVLSSEKEAAASTAAASSV